MRFEVVFTGSGGQGVILSGMIVAEAAAIIEQKPTVQAQSYGPEARGGMVESYVIMSEGGEVDYPEITYADVIVALSQSGLTRQLAHAKPESVIIVDSTEIDPASVKVGKVYGLPFATYSKEILGRPISANIGSLGAMCALVNKVSREAVETMIAKRVPKEYLDQNMSVFRRGFEEMIVQLKNAAR